MMELACIETWFTETIGGAFDPARPVYNGEIPMEVSEPALVFQSVTPIADMMVQMQGSLYVDAEYDVFAASARGDRRYPHEDAQAFHDAIQTGTAIRYAFMWQGISSEWEITCDRISSRPVPIQDGAGDYRLSGGRYAIRFERIV